MILCSLARRSHQVLETVRVCLLEAIESPGLDHALTGLPVRTGEAARDNHVLDRPAGGRMRWGNAPSSGSEVGVYSLRRHIWTVVRDDYKKYHFTHSFVNV